MQALEAAGKNLTRQGLVNVVNNDGHTWSGPGLVPFRYSRTVHGGYGGVEMAKVVNGGIVALGGPQVTEPTASGAITPYTGTQPAPPASGIPSP